MMPRLRWLHVFGIVFLFVLIAVIIHIPKPPHQESPNRVPFPSSNLLMSQDSEHKRILKDVFISVKTSEKFHRNRLDLILKTWFNEASNVTYFFSDVDDASISNKTGNHLINTGCSSSHSRKALCCKMSVELETFMKTSNKRWFCHFDDDNYVNVKQLTTLLQDYNPQEDWYLGKISTNIPIIVDDRKRGKKVSFWFATGGAGFCLSRSLVSKMTPFVKGGQFKTIADEIRLPDDVTLGYIVDYMLNVPVTVIHHFHSHLEPLKSIRFEKLAQQISLSFSNITGDMNVISVEGTNSNTQVFDKNVDPTR